MDSVDKRRLILFGDVHGCINELKTSLLSLNFDPLKDRLIFTGDLVDRGPDSGAVVRFVRLGGYECVCGNHDDKHIRYFKHANIKKQNPHYKNPVNLSDDKRRAYNQLSDEDLEWMTNLPKSIYIEEHNILVIHAGVMPHKNPLTQPKDAYMYCRYINETTHKMMSLGSDFRQPKGSILWADVYDGDVNIVYGHNVYDLNSPHITTNEKGYQTIGLDTGCVFGGHLTCLVIEQGKDFWFHKTKSEKNYYVKH